MPIKLIDGKKLAKYIRDRVRYNRIRLRDAVRGKEYGYAAEVDGRIEALETVLADLEDARLAPGK